MSLAVVTDSTSSLPAERAAAAGVVVVPLHVVIDGSDHAEGPDLPAETVAEALRSRRRVTTARPSPQAFLRAYERAAEYGAEAIISVHLSGDLSGTFASAELAAHDAPVPVRVVDSRTVGLATGFAVEDAGRCARAGMALDEVVDRVTRRCAASSTRLYVDTLEHLRRGGRIGGAAALLGSALAIKPLLSVVDGSVAPLEKVRTAGRALARLEELSLEAAQDLPPWAEGVDVAVHQLAAEPRARELADRLAARIGTEVDVVEDSAVIGAHVGPGALSVAVVPREAGPTGD